jgi:hypothetical protein
MNLKVRASGSTASSMLVSSESISVRVAGKPGVTGTVTVHAHWQPVTGTVTVHSLAA